MKQTFYLYRDVDGGYLFSDRDKLAGLMSTGTVKLDVEPIKKEVEKVIDKPSLTFFGTQRALINDSIPKDAYDVKVIYKVKE